MNYHGSFVAAFAKDIFMVYTIITFLCYAYFTCCFIAIGLLIAYLVMKIRKKSRYKDDEFNE